MRQTKAALGLVLLLCLIGTVHNLHRAGRAEFQADFKVYYTAAALVLHGQTAHIYDGADDGSDPQLKFASPGTVYTEMARRHGIDPVRLYVYPPVLADLLAPLALLPERPAEAVWILLNLGALAWTGGMLGSLVGVRFASVGAFILGLGLVLPLAIGMCLLWGQITMFLLLLWAIGLFAYARGQKAVSAFALAMATAIKLTPLIVVAPMLLWADWRWLRGYVVSLIALVGAMCAINRPSLLVSYFSRVVPSMSRGIPNTENKSIISFVQLLYVAAHGGAIKASYAVLMPIPHGLLVVAKLCALLAVLAVLGTLAQSGRRLSLDGRVLSLALLATLSTCVSPVSWRHAYVFVVLPLVLLWAQALRRRSSAAELLVLTVCSIELGSFFFADALGHVLHFGYALALQALFAPAAGVLLALFFLRRQRLQAFALEQPAGRHAASADGSDRRVAPLPSRLTM